MRYPQCQMILHSNGKGFLKLFNLFERVFKKVGTVERFMTFYGHFDITFGLTYSSLNSAKQSCSCEVTIFQAPQGNAVSMAYCTGQTIISFSRSWLGGNNLVFIFSQSILNKLLDFNGVNTVEVSAQFISNGKTYQIESFLTILLTRF